MNKLEESIYDQVYENGFSSRTLQEIRENLNQISSEFLTDLLVENINVHTQYKVLIEFLSDVWNKNTNSVWC